MTATPELAAVKAVQQNAWGAGDYATVATRIHPIAENLVQAADLAGGARVLDIATGSGNGAIAAGRCGCVVTGLDYVPSLLVRARIRAAAEAMDIEWVEGDAEALPFPDASFDAVISVVGVMFAPDHRKAAAELLRVCAPGASIALANWTPDGFVGEMFRTVGKYIAPPPGLRPAVEWGTEEYVRDLLGDGVSEFEAVRTEYVVRSTTVENFTGFLAENFGPVRVALQRLEDDDRQALRADLLDMTRRYNTRTDSVAVPAGYLQVIARRSA